MMWGSQNLHGSVEGEMLDLIKDTNLIANQDEFMNLKNDQDRVDFVYRFLNNSAKFKKLIAEPKVFKSNALSLKYRTEGNEQFIRNKKYLEALELYSQSIAYAENESSFLAISYANRSAVLFEKKYYKECLEDIERALSNNYPENLKEKILKRKKLAESLKADQKICNYCSSAPEITNKNPLITAASDAVEIKNNETFGHHIVAVKNIKIGDIISVENSFTHMIHTESLFTHCHECLALCYNLIPCSRCTVALYCNEKCLEQAFNSFHKYECDFIPVLSRHQFLFIKMTIKSLKEDETRDENLDEIYRSDRFKEISSLVTNKDKRDFINLCIPAVMACLSYHALKNCPEFASEFDIDSIDVTLKVLLYQTSMIYAFNPFNIKKITYTMFETTSKRVGTAIYAFNSLYNHSCVPNCEFFHHGTILVTRATANIKQGEQCCLCYGISYSTTNILQRQRTLRRSYLFDCECRACTNQWPTFLELPAGKPLPIIFEEKAAIMYNNAGDDQEVINDLLTDAIRIFNSLEKFEPCQNFLRVQNLIIELYTMMSCKNVDF